MSTTDSPVRWFCSLCGKRTIVKSNRPRHLLSKKHIAVAVKAEVAKGHYITPEEQYEWQRKENGRRAEVAQMRATLKEWLQILKKNERHMKIMKKRKSSLSMRQSEHHDLPHGTHS